ncbi:flagellar basal body-associated FliL family protein [Candidatus Arthromitus sp. SFB-turkey]|uniref:flagellar basal body-associated FliL family protein n=1 Tax=Candidatus Arthromitus sp. SFB-turkey TaxID=1840217 RepID=UPI0007F45CC0|nr:flagellar basal body-associated FliL family protein [Candidatus Arthromitus sp. SFB-turkey]OAT88962.1 flagellar basal body rod protein [Candidatus Arthromitus sp. SFB-turkey]
MAKDNGKKSNKGMLIIIILLLIVIVAGGVVGFLIISKNSNGGAAEQKNVEEVLTLEEVVVNINDPSLKRYIKFGLAITYNSKDKDILEDINSNIYKIKDGIIAIFKEKTVDDIESNQGIEMIKQEIKEKINLILEDNEIISVYFTNLLIH